MAKLQLAIRTTCVRVAKKTKKTLETKKEKASEDIRKTPDGQFNNPRELYDEEYTSAPFPRVNQREKKRKRPLYGGTIL